MKRLRWLWCALAVLGGSALAHAAMTTVWEGDAKQCVGLANGAAFIPDAAAAGGQVLRIPYQAGAAGNSALLNVPAQRLQRRCLVTLTVRGEHLLDLGPGLWVDLVAIDTKLNRYAYTDWMHVHGSRLKPDGYTDISGRLDVQPGTYPLLLVFRWEKLPEGAPQNATVYLDRITVKSESATAPYVAELLPGKPRFGPKDVATAQVTLANPTDRAWSLTLRGEDDGGLGGPVRPVFSQAVTLQPGESKTVDCRWSHGNQWYGHEISVRLEAGGKVLDTAQNLYGVHPTPLWLSTGVMYDKGRRNEEVHSLFSQAEQTTLARLDHAVHFWRTVSPGMEYWEIFSWMGGSMAGMVPTDEVYPGGEGGGVYRSRSFITAAAAALNKAGMWPVTYVSGSWAREGYELCARHPEWYVYDASGELGCYGSYDMKLREDKDLRRDDVSFPVGYYPLFFHAGLNTARPDVQEFVARQFIDTAKQMGFRGLRMDWPMEVPAGSRDFSLKEIAPTAAENDKLGAAIIRRIKELVHREAPTYSFGFNDDPPSDSPLMLAERCRGGGWILHENTCGYQEKTCPYHIWTAYVKQMLALGEQVNGLGGIYQPFDFNRNGTPYPADNVYSALIRIVCGGRGMWYFDSSNPYGDFGRLSTRFSELFYGEQRKWIREVKDEVEVRSAAPLWGREMVFWNTTRAGQRQLIVNLVNPPAHAEVQENPLSIMNPPVRDITVSCAPLSGKLPRQAWLVTSEALDLGEEPQVQAVPLRMKTDGQGRATVTVPCVLVWKLVVFEY